MITLQFSNNIPTQEVVWVAIESSATKPLQEVFAQNGRKLVLQPGTSRQDREKTGALAYKKAQEGSESTLLLDLRNAGNDGLDFVSGILLASWRFDKYRTSLRNDEVRSLQNLIVLTEQPKELEQAFARTKASIEGVLYARELTSEPSNRLYPMAYAKRLLELEALGLEVEVLDENALQDLGMTALLAAGQGSGHDSCVASISWKGKNPNEKPIVLVGKGVCFDSGGLCIKPAGDMRVMKWDKAGAGVVAGVMKALALSNSPTHVVGIVGLVENMPDGKALKPGDVITTKSGQTVEIADTDAEGRLVLADCLWYAQERFNPKALIDLGTLTQETFASLGSAYAALYTENEELARDLMKAGNSSQDALWRLPMGEYFAKQLESTVADMKNLGTEHWGENGAAAEFLKRFIKSDMNCWAHIDIAGVSWTMEDSPLCTKGPTGFGVRLLEAWIHSL